MKKYQTPLDWRDELKEFDVLISNSGKLRVVRSVKYNKNGYLYAIELVALKPSWCKSPLACYFRNNLKNYEFKKADLKYVVKDKDLFLQKAIKEGKTIGWKREVTYEDVKNFT